MMPYPFDTDDLSDLTDEQIEAVRQAIGFKPSVRYIRENSVFAFGKAVFALARLMRDHPELFEKPVDPLLKEARELVAHWYRTDPQGIYETAAREALDGDEDAPEKTTGLALTAIKRGIELAKGGEA